LEAGERLVLPEKQVFGFCLLRSKTYISGWWYTYPSEKYEFVSWDDNIPNIWKVIKNVPKHQPDIVYPKTSVCLSSEMILPENFSSDRGEAVDAIAHSSAIFDRQCR